MGRAGTMHSVRVIAWTPACAIAITIWLLSATPDLAITSGTLDTVLRKFAHVGVFAALTVACAWGFRAQRIGAHVTLIAAAGVAITYAFVDEYHQTFVPTRHGAVSDVAIDAIGIAVASIVLKMFYDRRGVA